MNYSSASPTLLSCRKLQLHSVIPPYLNLAQYHLTICDRQKKKTTLLFGQPPLFLYKSSQNRTTMSSNNGISLGKIPGTSTISNDIDFIFNSCTMVNYNSQKLYHEFLSNRDSKFLSNNLVKPLLLSIPHFRSDSYYRINKRGDQTRSPLENRGGGISSSCWSGPGERCSIEISPVHTSLGIQVSKILIILMYNIYLSLISRNSNQERFNANILVSSFRSSRNTTNLRSI